MNVLDENILESQRRLLATWHVPFRQIGREVGRKGMADDEIMPFLLTLRQVILFTMDGDFFKPSLCHARYGLVYLDIDATEAAAFIRRFLHHSAFDSHAKCMGSVLRVAHARIDVWRLHAVREAHVEWAN